MTVKCVKRVLSVASLNAPALDIYSIKQDDKILHVWEAVFIRLLSQYFRVPYKIRIPDDGEWGRKLSDGNWTGMMGMVGRSEVDLAVGGITLTNERYEDFNFSYPYLYSETTFITDKPKPISTGFVLLYPFSCELWFSNAASFFIVSFLLFLLVNRKTMFQNILLITFGSLFGQPISFKKQNRNPRMLLSMWLIFIFVVTHSYKGLLFSFLSFTPVSGIRNFHDLAKSEEKNSVSCYTVKGYGVIKTLLESEFETWRSVGRCLERNVMKGGNVDDFFLKAIGNRAYVGGKIFIAEYERKYFFSEDSLFNTLYAFPISKQFACQEDLNGFILRVYEAGLILKMYNDAQFLKEQHIQASDRSEDNFPKTLRVTDFTGAILMLISGHILALFTLVMEIALKYYSSN